MAMAMGYSGGIPNSTERSSGARKPRARPQGPPSTKPASSTGKCMGQSMLPTWGTWPVIMGRTKASARNSAARTRSRAGEWVLVFMNGSSSGQTKKGPAPAFLAKGRPLHGVRSTIYNEKMKPGFGPVPGFVPEL